MREVIIKFNKLLNRLKTRGEMYITPYNYDTLIAYLMGYEYCQLEAGNGSPFKGFKEWLHIKVGHHCSMHWPYLIYDLYSDKNADLAIENFYEFYDEFSKKCLEEGLQKILEDADKL